MAKRITEYTNIETIAESDVLPIVDVSDTEQATTGSTRKGTVGKIADYIKDRAETLTNKILTTARLNTPKINEDVTVTATSTELNKLDGMAGDAVGTTDTQTLTNKTIKVSDNTLSGMLDWFYPIGTIYETTSTDLDTTTKMGNHFGGTWESYGSGKVLVAKSADTEFNTIGKTGGAKVHTHRQGGPSSGSSSSAGGAIYGPWNDGTFGRSSSGVTFGNYSEIVTSGIGSSKTVYPFLTEATSSLSPYIVVYRYRRTA